MKTQNMKERMTKGLLGLIALMSLLTTACSSGSGSGNSNSNVGITGYCSNCSNFSGGVTLFSGTAASPAGTLTSPGLQLIADSNGYSVASQSGLRPLVNGNYMAAVSGSVILNTPTSCANNGMQIPAGNYSLQMTQVGQVSNGQYYAQYVNLVGPVTIPGSVYAVFVDANLDNILDPGSLISVGFCGQWHNMNTQ